MVVGSSRATIDLGLEEDNLVGSMGHIMEHQGDMVGVSRRVMNRMGAPMDISMVDSTEDTRELMMGRVVGSSSNIVNKQGFQLSTDLKGWICGRSPVFCTEK